MQAYRTVITGLKLPDIEFRPHKTTFLCDVSTFQPCPIAPEGWRHLVFKTTHILLHTSIQTTRKLVATKFGWHSLHKLVCVWGKACIPCQQAKIQTHVCAPLDTFEVPARKFDYIHVDLVGLLPSLQGQNLLGQNCTKLQHTTHSTMSWSNTFTGT